MTYYGENEYWAEPYTAEVDQLDLVNMGQYNVQEAKTRLSELLNLVERGEDVVIAKAGRPVARLVKIERSHQARSWVPGPAPHPGRVLRAVDRGGNGSCRRMTRCSWTRMSSCGQSPNRERLSTKARNAITKLENQVYVSPVTAYELSYKHRHGKLPAGSAIVASFGRQVAHLLRVRASGQRIRTGLPPDNSTGTTRIPLTGSWQRRPWWRV